MSVKFFYDPSPSVFSCEHASFALTLSFQNIFFWGIPYRRLPIILLVLSLFLPFLSILLFFHPPFIPFFLSITYFFLFSFSVVYFLSKLSFFTFLSISFSFFFLPRTFFLAHSRSRDSRRRWNASQDWSRWQKHSNHSLEKNMFGKGVAKL